MLYLVILLTDLSWHAVQIYYVIHISCSCCCWYQTSCCDVSILCRLYKK